MTDILDEGLFEKEVTQKLREELHKINRFLWIMPLAGAAIWSGMFYLLIVRRFLDNFFDGLSDVMQHVVSEDLLRISFLFVISTSLHIAVVYRRFFNQNFQLRELIFGIGISLCLLFLSIELLADINYLTHILMYFIYLSITIVTKRSYPSLNFSFLEILFLPIPFAILVGIIEDYTRGNSDEYWLIGTSIGFGMGFIIMLALKIATQRTIKITHNE